MRYQELSATNSTYSMTVISIKALRTQMALLRTRFTPTRAQEPGLGQMEAGRQDLHPGLSRGHQDRHELIQSPGSPSLEVQQAGTQTGAPI